MSFFGVWKSEGGGLMPPVASLCVLFPRVWGVVGAVSSLSEVYDRAEGERLWEGDWVCAIRHIWGLIGLSGGFCLKREGFFTLW